MTHMFIAGAEIANGQTPTFHRDQFRAHMSAVEALASAGIPAPAEWLALRSRYADYIDLGDHAVDRLTAEIITPTGADLTTLRANALAEEIGRAGDAANINQKSPDRGRAGTRGFVPARRSPELQTRRRTLRRRRHPLHRRHQNGERRSRRGQLLTVSAAARDYWLAAPALAAELDTCRAILYAAASLVDAVPADVAFVSGASDLTTIEYQIAIACDPGKAHRRKVWAAWARHRRPYRPLGAAHRSRRETPRRRPGHRHPVQTARAARRGDQPRRQNRNLGPAFGQSARRDARLHPRPSRLDRRTRPN